MRTNNLSRRARILLAVVLCALLLWTALPVAAQTNPGEIGGVVRDASGGVAPGAIVTAKHKATGATLERATNAEGRFFFHALQIGEWEIHAVLAGFAPRTQQVILEMGRTLTVDITLGVAAVEEQVNVEVRAPLLQTETAEISDIIENREVVQLPLNGRNFLALAQLSDAVVIPPGGTRGEVYLLDGAKVTDELVNNLVINPSVDSIQEFKTTRSMPGTTFIRPDRRSLRSSRTSSAARSAGRSPAIVRFSSGATRAPVPAGR